MKNVKQLGFMMPAAIILMLALMVLTTAIMQIGLSNYKIARGNYYLKQAELSADAGIDYAISQINLDGSWAGTPSDVVVIDNGDLRSEFEITVTDESATTKTVRATGKTYYPASDTTPKHTVIIEAGLGSVGSSAGNAAIATGVGGLYMKNNSKILDGDVLVNGELSMQNNSQIGLTTNSVNVNVAHKNCPDPPNASYPRPCVLGENGEPITMNNNATIYGTVTANNQVDGSGMQNPGLVAGSVSPYYLPDHDRDAQKAAVTETHNESWAECTGGNKTYGSNLKITGNAEISGSCDLTITGDVWIEGDFIVKNNADIIISDSVGTAIPNIMVDGDSGVLLENNSEFIPNSFDTGANIITYYSKASCSPDCADVIGQDLYDTREETTIFFKNNADAPEVFLYARWSQVEMGNNGDIGALAGQTVLLDNNGAVTFGTSVGGGGGGSQTWLIRNYNRVFN